MIVPRLNIVPTSDLLQHTDSCGFGGLLLLQLSDPRQLTRRTVVWSALAWFPLRGDQRRSIPAGLGVNRLLRCPEIRQVLAAGREEIGLGAWSSSVGTRFELVCGSVSGLALGYSNHQLLALGRWLTSASRPDDTASPAAEP